MKTTTLLRVGNNAVGASILREDISGVSCDYYLLLQDLRGDSPVLTYRMSNQMSSISIVEEIAHLCVIFTQTSYQMVQLLIDKKGSSFCTLV